MSFITKSFKNGVRTIKINRPERNNAICSVMYQTIANILNEDACDKRICVTIITGQGEYFSSGNDLKSVFETPPQDIKKKLSAVPNMIDAVINYPKLLITVVNGPAIGIGATLAALCDIVYGSDKAVFDAPFIKLGLSLEGASSFTFPFSLGRSKASEVLYLNHKLSAQEAYQFGLISKIIPHHHLEDFIEELHKYGQLPVNNLANNKKLVMANFKQILSESSKREFEQLAEYVDSEDFLNAAVSFISRKNKL